LEAWAVAHQINIWLPKGRSITAQTLLAPMFGAAAVGVKSNLPQTKEEFEAYKKDLMQVAKWHSKVAQQIKDGTRESTTASTEQMVIDSMRGQAIKGK